MTSQREVPRYSINIVVKALSFAHLENLLFSHVVYIRKASLDLDTLIKGIPAAALGLVAIVFALAAVLAAGGTDLMLAVLAVVSGALAAGYLLLQ